MLRKKAWIAVCGTLMSGALALAQGPGPAKAPAWSPYGNPDGSGYPGYAPPIGPGMPRLPYGYPPPMGPMVPGMPNGFAPPMGAPPGYPYGFAPPMGLLPSPGLPAYTGSGAKSGASEPYLVPPASPPAARPTPLPLVQTPAKPGPAASGPIVVSDPIHEQCAVVDDGLPNEPYTLYEGRRYFAEIKNDCTCVWVQASFIHWWIRRDNTPPLVTTGGLGTPSPGSLSNPGTSILLGNGSIGPTEFSGLQATMGMWLDEERLHSFEVGGFWVGKSSRQYGFASDAGGNPFLAQPFQTPAEIALPTAAPGVAAGSIFVNNIMDFHGVEANLGHNLFRLNGWSIDSLIGARYLYLNDNLSLNQTIAPFAGTNFVFNGATVPDGSSLQLHDGFNVTNRFYGGQIGARVNWAHCGFDFGVLAKLGLGATAHTVIIDGTTTLNPPTGASSTVAGSSLAQASNIGRHGGSDFSIVPELNATFGYQISSHLRLLAGYNLIYWNRIERASGQIDTRLDLTQSPTDGTFVPGKVGTNPLYPNTRTDFWAYGLNLGVEVRY